MRPPDETLSTAALVALARAEATHDEGDPDEYWDLVAELHDRDPLEVWALLAPLAGDADPRVQQLVPHVLRHLGHEAQPLAVQTLQVFAQMLAAAPHPDVLAAIGTACIDFYDAQVVTLLAPHAAHPSEDVREAVGEALRRYQQPEALAALMHLSRDPVAGIREWATYCLGSQLPLVDGADIREALAARLTDAHPETRAEAVVGLGLRGDARALGPLLAQFERGFFGVALFEAARGLASPVLLEALRALETAALSDEERTELTAALAACGGSTAHA